jgi:hypothetical protein
LYLGSMISATRDLSAAVSLTTGIDLLRPALTRIAFAELENTLKKCRTSFCR